MIGSTAIKTEHMHYHNDDFQVHIALTILV